LLDKRCYDDFIDRKLLNILEKLMLTSQQSSEQSSVEAVVVVKIDVFPMKLQHQIISNITQLLNDKSIPEDELDISPTNYTLTLSIVQLDTAEQHNNNHNSKSKNKNNNNNNKSKANFNGGGCHGTFLVGVTNCIIPQKIYSSKVSASMNNDDDTIICRAYCKLEEVFHRWWHCTDDDGNVDDENIVTTTKKPFPFLTQISFGERGVVAETTKRRLIINDYQEEDNREGGENKTTGSPLIAVDCGSAPGGWTKFLTEHTCCFDVIYSIDPAEMDKRVSSLPVVEHLQMTSEDAISHLCHILSSSPSSPCCDGEGQNSLAEDDNNERDCTGGPVTNNTMTTVVQQQQQGEGVNRNKCKKISLWVSDMCLHEYTNQVDTLLRVRDMGMTMNNCAFVVTLKFCNAGHGRGRYDELAIDEACRLQVAGAMDVKVMHLFSNRLSERTLVGFI
jgi:23S rRNA U2552 (ribose-2'-O)-methylase RlmE/FtsJ